MLCLHGLDPGHVLQRRPQGATIALRVTGSAGPFPEVTITAGRAELDQHDGELRLTLSGLPAGGPYELRLSTATEAVVRDFYVGDLWLLAGQSNMEGVGVLAGCAKPHPLVRSFSLARSWAQAKEPLHVLAESPDEVHHGGFPLSPTEAAQYRNQAVRGAGLGLPFARLRAERTGVPQGLICVAHGGTSMSQWLPGQPLHESMMVSLRAVGQPLTGVLWYQGCSDTNTPVDAGLYSQRTRCLVQDLREELGQPELPWLVAQIATEVGRTTGGEDWHSVQEQQRRLPEAIPFLDVCGTADLEHDDWIHLSTPALATLAARLAHLADRWVTPALPAALPAPQPLRVRWEPDALSACLVVECTQVSGELSSSGAPLGFVLRDATGRERPLIYQVRFEGSSIRLRLTDDDLVGLSLFHGVGAQPQINTVDARGLPLPVFGPLTLEGLPPLSPWLRDWMLSPLSTQPLDTLAPTQFSPGAWTPRRTEGWNVVNQHDTWAGGDFCQLGQAEVELGEGQTFEIHAGGDGPLRVWWNQQLVVDDPRPVRDLGTVRISPPLTSTGRKSTITVGMNNRGGQSWGFFARLKYLSVLLVLATVLGAQPAPVPITFTGFFADPIAAWTGMKDEVGKVIQAKTGVTLKAEFPVGPADHKIALIAASGQYPDFIAPKGQSADLIRAGALLDLTDLIAQHAPNIRKILGTQIRRLRYSSTDPSIYFIPNTERFGQVNFDTDAWFKVQLRALEEAGYPPIVTLKDFEAVIQNYVRLHPRGPDGKPTIGLSLLADDWRFVISTTNPAFYATGAPDDGEFYINPQTFQAQEHFFRPDEREYFRWLNHMNAMGLLDPESFVQKFDQYKQKIASGRVVGLIDALWNVQDPINALKAAGKFDQTYGRFGAVLRQGIVAAYNQPTGFSGGWGIAITRNCKDPIRAIQFLDYLASDEAQVLINWGIKGKHYLEVGGKRVVPSAILTAKANDTERFQRTTGIGNYGISLHYGDGVLDPSGNTYTANFPDTIAASYSDAERRALKAYGVIFWNDLLPPASAFALKPWGAAWSIPVPENSILKQHWEKEQAIVRRRIPEAILGRPNEFDRRYDLLLAELKATTGAMAEAESALIRDRIALWTK